MEVPHMSRLPVRSPFVACAALAVVAGAIEAAVR